MAMIEQPASETNSDTIPLLTPPPTTTQPTSIPSTTPATDQSLQPPSYSHPQNPIPPPTTRRVRFSTDTDNTSLLPSYSAAKYGAFSSEAEYLSALRAWAEEKTYLDAGDKGLVGFYGRETMEGYIARPGGGMRTKKTTRKQNKGTGEGEGMGKGHEEAQRDEKKRLHLGKLLRGRKKSTGLGA